MSEPGICHDGATSASRAASGADAFQASSAAAGAETSPAWSTTAGAAHADCSATGSAAMSGLTTDSGAATGFWWGSPAFQARASSSTGPKPMGAKSDRPDALSRELRSS